MTRPLVAQKGDWLNNDDFIVSAHALERFEERFPTLWTNDDEVGKLIYDETMDALAENRVASVPPIELAHYDPGKWVAGKSKIVWTPNKVRGYVIIDGYQGTTVATVLVGRPATEARSKMQHKKAMKRKQRR